MEQFRYESGSFNWSYANTALCGNRSCVFHGEKALPGAVIALGVLIILITLLTSVRFRPLSASLWQYIVMFGMIAAGAGLLAKSLFKKVNKNWYYSEKIKKSIPI